MTSGNMILAVIVTINFLIIFILACIIAFVPASDSTDKTNSGYAALVFSIIGLILGAIMIFSSNPAPMQMNPYLSNAF